MCHVQHYMYFLALLFPFLVYTEGNMGIQSYNFIAFTCICTRVRSSCRCPFFNGNVYHLLDCVLLEIKSHYACDFYFFVGCWYTARCPINYLGVFSIDNKILIYCLEMKISYTLFTYLIAGKKLEDIFIKNISRLFVQQITKIIKFLNNSFFNFTVIIKANKSKCHGKTRETKNVCKKSHIRAYFYKGKPVKK